jgi:hypothetical protein
MPENISHSRRTTRRRSSPEISWRLGANFGEKPKVGPLVKSGPTFVNKFCELAVGANWSSTDAFANLLLLLVHCDLLIELCEIFSGSIQGALSPELTSYTRPEE